MNTNIFQITSQWGGSSCGFGFGVWRNVYPLPTEQSPDAHIVAWSVCFGPFTFHRATRVCPPPAPDLSVFDRGASVMRGRP